MIFSSGKKVHAVEIPFNWHVEYLDNTSLSEYNEQGKRNDFYSIRQHKVARFGLFNHEKRYFFEAIDGSFNLAGKRLEIEYHKSDGEVIRLTAGNHKRDLITYKEAYTDLNLRKQGVQKSNLKSINFGYKTMLPSDIFFQSVVSLPAEGQPFMEVKMTSKEDLDGHIVFKHKGQVIEQFIAPLTDGRTGQINWIIKF